MLNQLDHTINAEKTLKSSKIANKHYLLTHEVSKSYRNFCSDDEPLKVRRQTTFLKSRNPPSSQAQRWRSCQLAVVTVGCKLVMFCKKSVLLTLTQFFNTLLIFQMHESCVVRAELISKLLHTYLPAEKDICLI